MRPISARLGLVAAACLAAACSDNSPVGVGRSFGPPQFSFSPAGIQLDKANSGLPQSGRRFVKGFNPINPQNGDAIVVTAFWVGNTNIVTAVTDHLVDANFTPVGNTYHLVEYVTAGGISMATYVATGVQNIPPANPDGTNVYAIEVALSDSVPTGGIMMSAYSGVEDVFITALGAHTSASGSASAPTQAHPGTLTTTSSGALAYGVTMTTPPVGFDPPPGWNADLAMQGLSDATIKADGRYLVVANPASVDPTWTWYYDQTHAGTWLASGLVLKAATSSTNQPPVASFTSSCSALACNFTSTSSDPDGSIAAYSWNFGDGSPTATSQNASHTYAAAGTYTVTLTVTDNQGATNTSSQSVTVTPPNQPPVSSFTKSCSGLTCSFTSTSSDPDGSIASYRWTFGDGSPAVTTQNASHTYAAGGTYTVTLTVTDNQGATNSSSQSVTVTAPNQAPVVNAGPDQTVLLGVLYTLNASFSDPDNGPWTYRIDWGDGSSSTGSRSTAGSFSATHTYLGLLTQRTIRVTVTDSRGASGSDTKVITLIL